MSALFRWGCSISIHSPNSLPLRRVCHFFLKMCPPFLSLLVFDSFVFKVISLLLFSRFSACTASALQSLILHLSPSSDCCVRLCLAILYMCPRKPLQLSASSRLLHPPLPCNPLFVTQLWAACRLQSFTFVSLCLHLSPSSGLCLAVLCLPALDAASSSCRVFRF